MENKRRYEFKIFYVPQTVTCESIEEFNEQWKNNFGHLVPPVEKVVQLEQDVTDLTIKKRVENDR